MKTDFILFLFSKNQETYSGPPTSVLMTVDLLKKKALLKSSSTACTIWVHKHNSNFLLVSFWSSFILLKSHENKYWSHWLILGIICSNSRSNSSVLNMRLPFWEKSSRPPVSSWNLPFWDDSGLNVKPLWIFQVDHTFWHTRLSWKSWLLVTKLGAWVALGYHLHPEW